MQAWPSSPSFNSYSSSSVNMTEIAGRVVEEFREVDSEKAMEIKQDDDGGIKEDEFEFTFVYNKKQETPPISSADEIFFNGQIKPFYSNNNNNNNNVLFEFNNRPKIRKPLGELMKEDRESSDSVSLSCSSSEADDLDSLQPGTYCVWNPEASSSFSKESSRRCNKKKSHSMGYSKRWNKLRDFLLYRSNSEGKDTFVFLTPTHNDDDDDDNNNKKKASEASVHQENYVRNLSIKEEDKKLSFLPYRQDFMGFFNDSNGGLTKNLLLM